MMKSEGITWLASYPKSGNTWVRALLEAYRTGIVDINHMSTCVGDLVPYFYHSVSPTGELTSENTRLLRSAALFHMKTLKPCDPLVVKTHYANVVVDEAAVIPPALTDRAIYIIRDPRDVAVSYAKHFDYTYDAAINAMADPQRVIVTEPFEHILGSYSMHVKSWTCEQAYPILLVRYEQLLADPYKTFGGVLAFLGFTVNEERLHAAVELCDFSRLRAQEVEKGFREKKGGDAFFNTGRAGVWESCLTNEQAERIVEDHKEIFDEFYPTATREGDDAGGRDEDGSERDAQASYPPRWSVAHHQQERDQRSAGSESKAH